MRVRECTTYVTRTCDLLQFLIAEFGNRLLTRLKLDQDGLADLLYGHSLWLLFLVFWLI
jgi:hypothetical protein